MASNSDNSAARKDSFAEDSSSTLRQVQARKSSNLAFAFFCMEKGRAKDMEIFYTYCRILDDIADDTNTSVEAKIASLKAWKAEIAGIYLSLEKPQFAAPELSALGAELQSMISRRKVPQRYMQDIIDGVMQDTTGETFETFDDLRKYCYGVASAVGLVSIYIFGFKNPRTVEFAEVLGYAFQFTNILRDVVDDAHTQNRVYIPSKELAQYNVSKEDLLNPLLNSNCKALFKMHYFRAKHFFNKARRLLVTEDKKALTPALIMWEIYETILERIAKRDFDIRKEIVKIPKWEKIYLAFKAMRKANKPEQDNKKFGKVAVLGAGVAGVSAAINLAYEGFDVELFESKRNVGGRLTAFEWSKCGAILDNGNHALMPCYESFFKFTNWFGVEDAFYDPAKSMQFLFKNSSDIVVDYPDEGASKIKSLLSVLNFRKLDGFLTLSNVILFAKIKMGFAKALSGETALNYLKRNFIKKEIIEVFWEPFCVSTLNTKISEASADMLRTTLKESILKGMKKSALIIPQRPLVHSFWPNAQYFLECVGAKIHLSEMVKSLKFSSKKLESFETTKGEYSYFKYVFSALNWKALANLLPAEDSLKNRLLKISGADILNVHFLTRKKLFESQGVCLTNSPLHWVFDQSQKLPHSKMKKYHLYSITISASQVAPNKESIEPLVTAELHDFFGNFEIVDMIHILCKNATISADNESENSRPESNVGYDNFYLLGDWVKSGLPCTIESAARTSENVKKYL